MIFVDRAEVPEPSILNKRYRDGKTETERALDHYADPWDNTNYEFKRYSEDEVKDALEELFDGKCAYCESNFRHISPEDIEHWRPKGAVILEDGTEQKPAYYWLAAIWGNLLPSCIDCNRRRRQEDVRDPANEQSGKQNLFPVLNEQNRWKKPGQANQNGEVPLLLDPCVDEPATFFKVSDEAVIQEKESTGLENKKARASIDVFGLNRSALVQVRKEHLKRIIALFRDIRSLARWLPHQVSAEDADEMRDDLKQKLRGLKEERDESSCYLLMKQPLIDEFIAQVGPTLQDLGIGV